MAPTMRLLSSVALALLLLLLSARVAFGDPVAPVVVVEISGDIEDQEGLWAAIASELHATAVPPGDPRATSARGSLRIEARAGDKRMSATYRSVGAPLSRTVDLPSDPKDARGVAVLLAANVARESDGPLNGTKKPPTPGAPV